MPIRCEAPQCNRPARARRLCTLHYQRLKTTGRFDRKTTEERFWEKVNKDGPVPPDRPDLGSCWIWTAGTSSYGYGTFGLGARAQGKISAHVWAWTKEHGPVPAGLELDHLCRVHACCRPSHLDPVSHKENMARGIRTPRKTACQRGHSMAEGDPNVGFFKDGKRFCRSCKRDRHREEMARYRALDPERHREASRRSYWRKKAG